MNRRRLIAAIGEVRSRLSLLEDRLENGDYEGALALLDDLESAWADALEEIRS